MTAYLFVPMGIGHVTFEEGTNHQPPTSIQTAIPTLHNYQPLVLIGSFSRKIYKLTESSLWTPGVPNLELNSFLKTPSQTS
jgi:hypothetical protein